MARKPPIKWRDIDSEKLDLTVKKFNAKIYRARHNHPELADIQPETIKKADKQRIIDDLKNAPRSEYNKTIKGLGRYLKQDAETLVESKKGIVTTKWEKHEVMLKAKEIDRQRAREAEAYEAVKPSANTRTMGDVKHNELKPLNFDFNKIDKGKGWEKYKAMVNNQSRYNYHQEKIDKYKQNYLDAITRNLGQSGEELHALISQLPAELLYDKFWDEDPVLRIQFTSDPLPAQQIADESMEHWEEIIENEGEEWGLTI